MIVDGTECATFNLSPMSDLKQRFHSLFRVGRGSLFCGRRGNRGIGTKIGKRLLHIGPEWGCRQALPIE
jgi:hypothetical protein